MANIDVYVKLPSGKAISAQHHPCDTVRQVAAFVAKGEGVPESRLRLKYQGKTLDKTKTLGYLGVCAETILKGEVVFPKDLTVCLQLPGNRSEHVDVQNIDTVLDLKRKIHDIDGIPTSQQELKLNNGVVIKGDGSLLCDVGVVNDTTIEVGTKPLPSTSSTVPTPDTIEDEVVDESKKQALIDSFNTAGRSVEVVFCFDTTGSMYSCLSQVRSKLRESCERLLRDIPNIRIGVIAHGDYCDYNNYVIRYIDLTADVDTLVDFVENVPETEGGDAPEVRQKLRETCTRLLRDIPNIRIGIMANGDYCDDVSTYALRYVDLGTDIDTIVNFAQNASCTGGGGNGGECYEWALRKAQQLDWSEDSAKALVMIGDELPHVTSYTDQDIFWKDELDVLAGMEVKVYGVQALNQHSAKGFYEEMAERTNGYYLQLKNFKLITDMFLAVCYREAAPEQLEAFVDEMETDGRMTEETKVFMDKLEETKPKQTDEQKKSNTDKRYIAEPWWDKTLDSGRQPSYIYNQETDSWTIPAHTSTRPSTAYKMSSRASFTTSPKKPSKLRRFLSFVTRRKN